MNFNIFLWLAGLAGVGVMLLFIAHYKTVHDSVPGLNLLITKWHTAYSSEVVAFTKSEELRSTEQQIARSAATQSAMECEVRIKEARRSAGAIKEITHETVRYDSKNCPVRVMLDPIKLRGALGARH